MAIQISGPIMNLTAYAMLITYRLGTGTNHNRCACKSCGVQLVRGAGQSMRIRNAAGQWTYYYFCAVCCAEVAKAVQSFSAALSAQAPTVE